MRSHKRVIPFSQDISFVVCGKLDPGYSKECIKSIRKHFPQSEIIVSTWRGEVDEFIYGYDKIIYNEPLAIDTPQNILRQVHLAKAGIAASTKPFVFKVRSDLVFINDNIRGYLDLWGQQDPTFSNLKNRILVSNIYTHRPSDRPLFVCDFAYFGYREDISKIYQQDFYFLLTKNSLNNLAIEQVLALGVCPQQYHTDDALKQYHEQCLVNNFVVLDGQSQAGWICKKYPNWLERWNENIMTHYEWMMLYYKYRRLNIY